MRELRKHGSERGECQPQDGRNTVAPPGNQAANRENKPRPVLAGETHLLDKARHIVAQGEASKASEALGLRVESSRAWRVFLLCKNRDRANKRGYEAIFSYLQNATWYQTSLHR